MIVKELHLQNFRCFTDAKISFDERLTVFVGKNGSGKSAILDAVALSINHFFIGIHYSAGVSSQYALSRDDKTNTALYDDKIDIYSEFITKHGNICIFTKEDDINVYSKINNIKSQYIKSPTIFTYYRVLRLTENRNIHCRLENIKGMQHPTEAYRNCFQPTLSFADTFAWIDAHDAEEARRFRDGEPHYRDPELSAVREAVEKALPEFTGLRFRGTTKEILLTRKSDGQKLSFWQLSDGYRAMLALILDLSRRMALINGEKYTQDGRSILDSPAIVLIDEIELHLHPGWQQTALPSLMEIFPHTQFIVTTHSPQVLSSIEPHNIRLLDNGRCIPYEGSTYGAESSRILEEVFGISLRADTAAKTALDAYLKLIQNGDYGSPKARELREQLDKWLYGDPILDNADMLIRRAERQKAGESGRA